VKFHIFIVLIIITLLANFSPVSAQADSFIGQITSSPAESFVGGISGDGRLVVFESTGNLATENPRNADGNREIFIFDYAQRRIFQITDTKSLLTDTTKTAIFSNVKVEIINTRPVISNNGRWIAFGSNATTSTPAAANNTNPGSFDANSFTDSTGNNPLTSDGNTEIWLYQIPAVAPVNLSSGSEIPLTNLDGGAFTRVTNTAASRPTVAGTTTATSIIADDNREATINNNGNYIAFVSNRDLAPSGNVNNASSNGNDEIFTYVRSSNTTVQVTQTPRGTLGAPIFNGNPSISGDGSRVAFLSNANNPIVGMTGDKNADGNVEIFYTDLDAAGTPNRNRTQVTTTTRTAAGQILNIFNLGRRMSLDGRYIAFDSYADLANENGGVNQPSFALYLYDTTTATFRRIGPRSDADSGATGGDVQHFPGFTDYDANGTPQTLVLETRLNITADGTVSATNDGGLNPNAARPPQIYSYSLAGQRFNRLTKLPPPSTLLASTQPIPSNTLQRMAFSLGLTEIGTGNTDLANEAFYLLVPSVNQAQPSSPTLSFATGASRIPVSASPVPTPSPSTVTPPAVFGVSPGMLVVANFSSGTAVVSQTAVGSLSRSFTLPIELSGVSVSVNGAASGIKSVSQGEVFFVVPPALPVATAGTVYPIVINDNGTVIRGSITLVLAQPDIFTFSVVPGPGGRARIYNATNRVQTTEPFALTTVRMRGGGRVATILRVYLTGVQGVPASAFSIRVGSVEIPSASISNAVLREPGVYSVDFTLPANLRGAGDQPIIITVTGGGQTYRSRLDDTAPRFRIL